MLFENKLKYAKHSWAAITQQKYTDHKLDFVFQSEMKQDFLKNSKLVMKLFTENSNFAAF